MMKIKLTLLFLAIAATGFAQKKELRKVEKALDRQKFEDAQEEFNQIDENLVEEKYRADYTFFKGVTMLGDLKEVDVDADQLMAGTKLMLQSKELGFDDDDVYKTYLNVATANIFTKAQDELKEGDTKKALELVTFILDLEPDNDRMRFNAANLAYKVGDFKASAMHYQQLYDKGFTGQEETFTATEKATGKQQSFRSKKAADLAVLSGEYENAVTAMSDSEVGVIVSNLVWMYKNDDDADKALAIFKDAQKKYPNDTSLKIAEADLYLTLDMQEEYEKAVSSLDEEITDPVVFENLAAAAASKENWDQAIDYYTKSIALNADNYISQNNIATAYINKGNLDETTVEEQTEFYTLATKHLEKVLELKPNEASAKGTLISLYNALGMTEKAEKLK